MRKIGVSLGVYEEINLPVSDAGVSTVYSTAQLPTNPSEPSQTVYDNVQLPTNPLEPSQTDYDNVQLPSSCDFSNPLYSPAQLPSDSLLTNQIQSNRLLHSPIRFSLPDSSTHQSDSVYQTPARTNQNLITRFVIMNQKLITSL